MEDEQPGPGDEPDVDGAGYAQTVETTNRTPGELEERRQHIWRREAVKRALDNLARNRWTYDSQDTVDALSELDSRTRTLWDETRAMAEPLHLEKAVQADFDRRIDPAHYTPEQVARAVLHVDLVFLIRSHMLWDVELPEEDFARAIREDYLARKAAATPPGPDGRRIGTVDILHDQPFIELMISEAATDVQDRFSNYEDPLTDIAFMREAFVHDTGPKQERMRSIFEELEAG